MDRCKNANTTPPRLVNVDAVFMNRTYFYTGPSMSQFGHAIVLIPAFKYPHIMDAAMFIPNEWQPENFHINFMFKFLKI
jgi:hypothetical protein